MTFFKKEKEEKDNFHLLYLDYIFAKANIANLRFASVSDVMAFNSIEKVIQSEINKNNFEQRLAASFISAKDNPTEKDFRAVAAKYSKLRDVEVEKFVRKNSRKPTEQEYNNLMAPLRSAFRYSDDASDKKVWQFLFANVSATATKNPTLRQLEQEGGDASIAVDRYFAFADTEPTAKGVLDYIMSGDLDFKLAADPDTLVKKFRASVGNQEGRGELTKIRDKAKDETSLQKKIPGRKGEGDSEFESLIGDESPQGLGESPEEAYLRRETPQTKVNPVEVLQQVADNAGVDFDFDLLEQLLDRKEDLYLISPDEFTNEDLELYTRIHNKIQELADQLKNQIMSSDVFESFLKTESGRQTAKYLSEVISNVKDMFLRSGGEFQPSEVPAEPEEKPAEITPGSLAYSREKADLDRHFRERVVPGMYSQYGPLNVQASKSSIPLNEQELTPEQLKAAISGDPEQMNAAGVPVRAQFWREILQAVHDWQVQSMWESRGQKTPDSIHKKKANDTFFAKVEELKEKYKDYPDIVEELNTRYNPKKEVVDPNTGAVSVKPNTNWQYVQENFDVARLNSEFMWILQTVGQNVSGQPFTSFGQLSSDDPEMQSEINAEISKAIDEVAKGETHFGKGIAWLPTKDEKGMTRGKLHTYDTAQLKAYLQDAIQKLIANAGSTLVSRGKFWDKNPTAYGMAPMVKKTKRPEPSAGMVAEQTPDSDGTQLGQTGDNKAAVSEMKYGDSDDSISQMNFYEGDEAPYNAEMNYYHNFKDEEKPGKVFKRFKVVVR